VGIQHGKTDDLLKNYINPADYEYCEMDTDSAYLALSGVELEDHREKGRIF
jgi:hypothetical protein